MGPPGGGGPLGGPVGGGGVGLVPDGIGDAPGGGGLGGGPA